MGKLKLLKKGIDVIKGTSKKKGSASDPTTRLIRNIKEDTSLKELKLKKLTPREYWRLNHLQDQNLTHQPNGV